MKRATWLKGDRAWLIPALPSAPAAAYRQPQVTVVTPPTAPSIDRIEVELPDKSRLWTHVANVVRLIPPQPPVPRPASRKSKLTLASDEEQPSLW